ncbi:MAG: AAA-associated domain-containing protein [Nitrososphaerota archaeon]|nr:AAA-associated domain-containing protein [Candidatus Calditenuis fumarioli]
MEETEEGHSCPIDVTPSMITGLLEVLRLWKGRMDLNQLAREVGMEPGLLLRVAEVGKLLGLLEFVDGDLVLTKAGESYTRRSSSGKLGMLRELVPNIEPFRSVIGLLERNRSPMTVSEINEHLKVCTDDEQLETFKTFLIDWLVATGILEYSGEEETFRLKRRRARGQVSSGAS